MTAAQSPDLPSEGKAWWAHVQFLADDTLEGRNVGTPGYEKAVDYVESQFKAIGLKPAGTSGFRQPVKFDSRKLAADQSQLVLVRDGKEEPLVIGQDGSLNARGELNGSKEASMVFIGYGLSIPDAGWDDLAGVDVRGKIAVYVNAFAPVKVTDNVKSHANTADERWAAVKRAGGIGIATHAADCRHRRAPQPPARGGGGWRTAACHHLDRSRRAESVGPDRVAELHAAWRREASRRHRSHARRARAARQRQQAAPEVRPARHAQRCARHSRATRSKRPTSRRCSKAPIRR